MTTGPMITTERLELSRPCLADAFEMLDILKHPATSRWLGEHTSEADHFTRFQRNAGSWLLSGYGSFTVRLRGHAGVIGSCGIFHSWRGLGPDFDNRAEAGWIVSHEHASSGYAAEAMGAAFAWFDANHGPQGVVCMIAPENLRSIRLAEKFGFAAMREAEIMPGETVILFERLRHGDR